MTRVLVVGVSGSGKTVLVKRLAEKKAEFQIFNH